MSRFPAFLAAFLLLAGASFVQSPLRARLAYSSARGLREKRFPALAAARLRPWIRELASDPGRCGELIRVFRDSRDSDSLGLASQLCLGADEKMSDAWLGLAVHLGWQGRKEEKLGILLRSAERFPKAKEINLELARSLVEAGKPQDAASAYWSAAEADKADLALAFEVLDFFLRNYRLHEAIAVGERLRDLDIGTVRQKLLVARSLLISTRPETAAPLISRARAELDRQPDRKALEAEFASELDPKLYERRPASPPASSRQKAQQVP